MRMLDNEGYDRERLALYLTGLLPIDEAEGRAVLDLCGELLPVLIKSKTGNQPCQRDREADEG